MRGAAAVVARSGEWLGLRPEDRRDAGYAFGTLLTLIAGHTAMEMARDTLFLSDLPATRLPWAYLTIAALALLGGWAVRVVARPHSRRHALTASLLGTAVVSLAFWRLSAARRPETLFALYVWTGLAASLVTIQFWLRTGAVFDVSRAKRVFTLIGAGGLAGATLGAAAAAFVLHLAGARALIVLGALLFAAAALVSHRWRDAPPAEPTASAARPTAEPAPAPSLRRDPYVARLLLLTVVATVVVTGLDYAFKAAVAEHVARERIGPFLARYQTAVNAGGLAFQLALAPRLIRGAGVIGALVLLPTLVMLGTAAAAAVGGLAAILLAKAADGTMRHSLDRAGHEILHLPLAEEARAHWRPVTAGLGQRGGQALASLAILAAVSVGASAQAVAAGLAVASAAWVAALVALRPHYVERFREQLRTLRLDLQGTLPPLDLPALETLVAALGSADDAEVLAALDLLEGYGKQHLVSPLIVHHPSPRVALRALELLAGSPREDVARLVDRALAHPDPDVRAAVLRLRTAHEPDPALLRRHLRDPSPAVRCAALVGLVTGGHVAEAEAEAALHELLGSATADACPVLARALVDLPPRLAHPLARALSHHPDPRVGTAVARALATEPHPLFLETLVELLAQRDARTFARTALVALGEPALERLGQALDDTDTAEAVRLHVPRSISRFPGPHAAALLVARLAAEGDTRVRYKILRGLGRMRTDDPALPIDRDALHAAAEAFLARAVDLLAYRVAWEALGRCGARLPPGHAGLLPVLLEDKERRALEGVFRVLHVLEPGAGYDGVYHGLAAADPRMRAGGREVLENVLSASLRPTLLAMTDALAPAARLAEAVRWHEPPDAAALLALREGGDAAALPALVRSLLGRLRADPNPLLREIARVELAAVDWDAAVGERAGAS